MEGSERQAAPGSPAGWRGARIGVVADVVRFVLALVFLVMGASLLAEGVFAASTGGPLPWFTDNLSPILNLFLGLVGVTLAALVLEAIRQAAPEAGTTAPKKSPR